MECARVNLEDAYCLNNLGYIEIKGKADFQTGIPLIERALELKPKDPMIIFSLATACRNSGDTAGAIARLEDALDRIPDNVEFIDTLIELYEKVGETEKRDALRFRKTLLKRE